jgi:hypothetical protein
LAAQHSERGAIKEEAYPKGPGFVRLGEEELPGQGGEDHEKDGLMGILKKGFTGQRNSRGRISDRLMIPISKMNAAHSPVRMGQSLAKEGNLKNLSWITALGLGVLLYYALAFPPSSSHVSLRYSQSAPAETGISSVAGAVAGDYRGFDLLLAGLLIATAVPVILLFFKNPKPVFSLPLLLWLGGTFLVLGLGFWTLAHGANFLDYEPLAAKVGSLQARPRGALLLTSGVLLNLGGLILLFLQYFIAPRGSHER